MNARQEWRDAICESSLDSTAKLVAYTLDYWMDGRGEAWPSKSTIAERAGKERSTVIRAISRLERAGFVLVIPSRGRRPSRYRACMPPPNSGTHATVNSGTHATVNGPTVPQPWQNAPPTVAPTPPESEVLESGTRGRSRAEEPKPAAGAYRKFADAPPDITIDEAALEQAKAWLSEHRL